MVQKNKKKKYSTNFITSVTLEIQFPMVLELDKGETPSEFQEKIINEFPITKEIPGGRVFAGVHEKTLKVKKEERVAWLFLSKDKKEEIFLEPEILEIKFKQYTTFEEYYKRIKYIIDCFFELYPIKLINRISLNYINKIELDEDDPLKWEKYIPSSLFSIPKKFIETKAKPLQYLNVMEFKESECQIRFIYGLHNSEYPNPINRKEFILDYNCFINDELEISYICDKIKKLHKIEDQWFEMSITDELRRRMGVE